MKIVIVGGGTAGWLTAFGLSYSKKEHSYTVIDSSKVGIIGVGESTTGNFSCFAKDRGISREELILGVNALPKYGVKFFNWHPSIKEFISPVEGSMTGSLSLDYFTMSSIALDFPMAHNSVGGTIVDENKTDFFIEDNILKEGYGGIYPLHIDTHATGEFFKRKSLKNNVTHLDSTVTDVTLDPETGFIKSLTLTTGEVIEGDLFIDCSGFAQVLIKKMNPEWIDYSDFLPVNSAIPFNLIDDDNSKNPYTTARAMSSGWMWEIPSRNITNRGYIYCDKFITEEKAIEEVEQFFNKKIKKVKSIKFKAGRLETPWIKNCVAIGLASAFLEPLQATSIHCTVSQIEDFIINCLDSTLEQTMNPIIMKKYNSRISKLYSHMADLISLHYSGGREDTEFWRYVKNDISRTPRVNEILNLAKTRGTRLLDFDVHPSYAGQHIWNHSLAGLGHFDKSVCYKICKSFDLDLSDVYNSLHLSHERNKNLISKCLTVDDVNNFLKKGSHV
jgi:tryptophan halogenase